MGSNEETTVWRQFKDEIPPAGKSFLFRFDGDENDEWCIGRSDADEGLKPGSIRLLAFPADRIVFYSPLDQWALWPPRQEENANG